MDPPHFLLDALKDSITSGTFIDTKFYVFARREASGRVGSPRPLYCNSKVLKTVPYFSTLLSDGFSEGQMRNINDTFPSDIHPYTEDYGYLSDSDLEDEEELTQGPLDLDSKVHLIMASENPLRLPQGVSKVGNGHEPSNESVRMGQVAIIRDIAALTFEAMVYFLYTGEITFAPSSTDPRHKLPMEARTGNWNTASQPSTSAKSIYRLADKYDIPILKELAMAHIYQKLTHGNLVHEVFSSFSLSFPEILSLQVSWLFRKMKEESKSGTESGTIVQLLDKIASLSQSQLGRAADALSMIWDGFTGPLELPVLEPKSTPSMEFTLLPNWHRVKLALFKSIFTGTFIDVQFYAYNASGNNLPLDPKPLFVSSIVIEEWGPAITTQTVGIGSQAMCLADGLNDDYEHWPAVPPGALHEGKGRLKYQTEAAGTHESREVVMLISGAWKTWMTLLSYPYTNEMDFAPLQTSARDSDSVVNAKAQQRQPCSPRSMYSLATALGIENIKEEALKDLRSKITASNITQELFTSFAASHKEIMEMEIKIFHKTFAGQKPKSLMDHIQRMASGEAPFFPSTLRLVYSALARKAHLLPITSGPGLGKPRETGDQSVAAPVPAIQASNSTSNLDPSPTSNITLPSSPQSPVPENPKVYLRCFRCSQSEKIKNLYDGLRCQLCDPATGKKVRPFMQCPLCSTVRTTPRMDCSKSDCKAVFA